MNIKALKKLALLGAHQKPVELSSLEFASILDTSPQTAARKLKALEDEDLISRQIHYSGQLIFITKNGMDILQKEYYEYQEIFSENSFIKILNGKVITGLGEGQYYISLEGYRKQFREKLGFDPYPGTLNLKLDNASIEIRKSITGNIKITGFSDENRTFGNGTCFNVRINDLKGTVIVPERTHYPEDIIEIIAPVNIREHLNVKDGSLIQVEVIK